MSYSDDLGPGFQLDLEEHLAAILFEWHEADELIHLADQVLTDTLDSLDVEIDDTIETPLIRTRDEVLAWLQANPDAREDSMVYYEEAKANQAGKDFLMLIIKTFRPDLLAA